MPQPNDLSRSLVALDQNSTIIAVVELSQSSWLVGGVVPGIERQPRKKLEPSPERLLAVLHRWRDEAVRAGRTITRIALAFDGTLVDSNELHYQALNSVVGSKGVKMLGHGFVARIGFSQHEILHQFQHEFRVALDPTRCSRETATLEGWITCASTPRACSGEDDPVILHRCRADNAATFSHAP
jgi:hypothetical protein